MSGFSDLDGGAISFAERVLTLLDRGNFVSTYKYAVLLGLMDLILELTEKGGSPPSMITTRQLTGKIIEIYWPHTNTFEFDDSKRAVLLQNSGQQAAIINLISDFKSKVGGDSAAPFYSTKIRHAQQYELLKDEVAWKLIEMPLSKLQRVGNSRTEFIYRTGWDNQTTRAEVRAYQQRYEGDFDNQLYLQSNVGEYFVRLNGLLRPLIHREWSIKVAQTNKLKESQLQDFLFGANRGNAAVLCGSLSELQSNRCFYCDELIGNTTTTKPEVDHFIPWARYPMDSVMNYVVAHSRCNHDKRDFLAANDHVARWVGRFGLMSDFKDIANQYSWNLGEESTLGVASAIYSHLQPEVELWKVGRVFEVVDRGVIGGLFG